MNPFQDAVTIVTGGASGIGLALCKELARRGARVVVADCDAEGAGRAAREINAAGGRAKARGLDVTREAEVTRCVRETAEVYGRLDYLFNNAGIGVGGEMRDMSLDDWRKTVDVNLWGVVYGCHAAYPIMIDQGSGHIVNTASLAGLFPTPGELPYTTTKFAVVGLSTAMRTEAEGLGVKVSVVCPGFVKTNIFETSDIRCMDTSDVMDILPTRLFASPDKVAREILAGVEKNQSVIVVTRHGRMLYRLYCTSRRLWKKVTDKMIRDMRARRKES